MARRRQYLEGLAANATKTRKYIQKHRQTWVAMGLAANLMTDIDACATCADTLLKDLENAAAGLTQREQP